MKNNSYNLNKDVLTIRTAFGHYRFKIEELDLLDNAERIVRLMISEIDNVDKKLSFRKEKSGQYARLLLSNLNICEKYIQLEDKYRSLTEKLETINRKLDSANVPPQALLQTESVVTEEVPIPHEPPSVEVQTERVQLKPDPVSVPMRSDPQQAVTERMEFKATEAEASDLSVASATLPAEPLSVPIATDAEQKESDGSSQPYIAVKRSSIASWKLKHSYIALKRRAMERDMQVKEQPQTTLDGGEKQAIQEQGIEEESTIAAVSIEPSAEYLPIAEVHPEPVMQPSQPIYISLSSQVDKEHEIELILQDEVMQRPSHEVIHASSPEVMPVPSSDVTLSITVQETPASPESLSVSPASEVVSVKSQPTYIINRPEQSNQYIQKPKVYRKGEFQLPNLSFLKNTSKKTEVDHHSIRRDAELLEKKLGYFGIKGEVMGVSPGPVITTFEYRPEPGIKISKIVNLADDLALALSAFSIRIVAPIPGKDVMGIEIPNIKKSLVPFIDIVNSSEFINSRSKVPICLGKDIIGNPVVVELDKMPHLLIAGATGTGKSVGLNAMITSILYKSTPEEVKFLMVDPKRIELSFYNDIPHLLTPVITDMKKATIALQWMVREMDRRYSLLAKSQVRHIEQYNQKIKKQAVDQYGDIEESEPLPFIVVIIDELADLMMTASRDIEFSLTRLAQMARAAGIHLILATQRPSVDVLTGIIKANFPTRISFQVSSKTDSRTIIDSNGAETLLGNGDMLFVPPGTARLTRVHGTYLSEEELLDITSFLKAQGKPEYVLDVITETDQEPSQESMDDDYDDKYNEALEFVVATRQASISGIQRALRVGYNRAARIIDIMEKRGIVGPSDGVKPRRVIVENIEY